MSRQPQQVHIFLYRLNKEGVYEFAIFRRADNPLWWQGICGGVENGETAEEGARREALEEAGIADILPLYKLDTISCIPSDIFLEKHREAWGRDVVVIPMYFYAIPFDGVIELSDEHTEYKWLPYKEAEQLIYFPDQRVALWELKERLLRGNLIRY